MMVDDEEGRPMMEEEMSINNKMIFEKWSGEKEGGVGVGGVSFYSLTSKKAPRTLETSLQT
jgi:hypothetical protein